MNVCRHTSQVMNKQLTLQFVALASTTLTRSGCTLFAAPVSSTTFALRTIVTAFFLRRPRTFAFPFSSLASFFNNHDVLLFYTCFSVFTPNQYTHNHTSHKTSISSIIILVLNSKPKASKRTKRYPFCYF